MAGLRWALLLVSASCFVDDSVVDELPCECGLGYVCDVARDRCVPEAQRDAGTDSPIDDAMLDAPRDVGADTELRDVAADTEPPDVGADTAPPDAGADAGSGPLGDCIVSVSDGFSAETISTTLWRATEGGESTVVVDAEQMLATVPTGGGGDYAFVVGNTRADLTNCTVVVELVSAHPGDQPINFFALRLNGENTLSFDVRAGAIEANYETAAGRTTAWFTGYEPAAHRWLALRGTGGNIAWLISPDGRDWTEVARVPAPFALENLEYLFGIGAWITNPDTLQARFDNFNRLP